MRARRPRPELGPALALVRRTFRDARIRTITFAYLFAIYAYIQPAGYRHTYSTLAERLQFARTFADNKALRLFYGEPHDVASVDGYTAWRVGGTLAIVAAVFGLLAAVRALRTEEESGRTELVLAGIVSRRTAYVAALTAIAAGTGILWVGEVAGFLVGGLPAGGSAYLALSTISVAVVFAGVGRRGEPARPDPPGRARARDRRRGIAVPVARDRRHRERGRLASVAHAARLGRGDAAVERRATAGAGAADRDHRDPARDRRAHRRRS